jgi:hypothetical protein
MFSKKEKFKNKILELDLKHKSNKIFGIGMPKTGTSSLHEALKILGYRSIHHPLMYKKPWNNFNISMKNLGLFYSTDKWDALTNWGEHTYPLLDKEFPKSKFILTIRDMDDWLKSTRYNLRNKLNQLDHMIDRMHTYHITSYNGEYLPILYENHVRNIKYYFRDRKEDLLIIDICKGDGWKELCAFLEKDIPDMQFPHKHITPKNYKSNYFNIFYDF